MDKKALEHLQHKQFRWDLYYPNRTVSQMMSLHRGLEVAEEAPEYVVFMEKKRAQRYNGLFVNHG